MRVADLRLNQFVEDTASVLAQAFSHTALGLKKETKQVPTEDRNAVVVESRTGCLAQG